MIRLNEDKTISFVKNKGDLINDPKNCIDCDPYYWTYGCYSCPLYSFERECCKHDKLTPKQQRELISKHFPIKKANKDKIPETVYGQPSKFGV